MAACPGFSGTFRREKTRGARQGSRAGKGKMKILLFFITFQRKKTGRVRTGPAGRAGGFEEARASPRAGGGPQAAIPGSFPPPPALPPPASRGRGGGQGRGYRIRPVEVSSRWTSVTSRSS